MIIDKDSNGNISITEMPPEIAMAVQSALLNCINKNQNNKIDTLLRSIAMQLDRTLNNIEV